MAFEHGDEACVGLLLPRLPVLPALGDFLEYMTAKDTDALDKLLALFLEELATRRTKLRDLARDHLSTATQSSLGLDHPGILDVRASEVKTELLHAGVHIPDCVKVSKWGPRLGPGAYYCCALSRVNVHILQKLWDFGFTDIAGHPDWSSPLDEVARTTLDPEDLRDQIPVADWLVSHGALDLMDDQRRVGTIRRLTARVGDSLRFLARLNPQAVQGILQMFPHWLTNFCCDPERHDSCECHCSASGCLGFHVIVQEKYNYWKGAVDTKLAAFSLLRSHSESLLALAPDIIRAFAFDDLGLRHTCCKFDREWNEFGHLDPEEVAEIQAEDSKRIELLENLVPEFVCSFEASGLELADYLETAYESRMAEVLAQFDELLDDGELAQIGRLGVRLRLVEDQEDFADEWTLRRRDWG